MTITTPPGEGEKKSYPAPLVFFSVCFCCAFRGFTFLLPKPGKLKVSPALQTDVMPSPICQIAACEDCLGSFVLHQPTLLWVHAAEQNKNVIISEPFALFMHSGPDPSLSLSLSSPGQLSSHLRYRSFVHIYYSTLAKGIQRTLPAEGNPTPLVPPPKTISCQNIATVAKPGLELAGFCPEPAGTWSVSTE